MSSNADPKSFRDRMYELLRERAEHSELVRNLVEEMKSAGLDAIGIAGIKLNARRRLLDDAKHAKRHAIEQFCLSLGD